MTILIQNTTNEVKSIYRFGGKKVTILPNDFITFECESIDECNFLDKISKSNNVSQSGIIIISDSKQIQCLRKLKKSGLYGKPTKTSIKKDNIMNVIKTTVEESDIIDIKPKEEPVEIEQVEEPIIYTEEKEFVSQIEEIPNEITTEVSSFETILDDTITNIDDLETTTKDNVEIINKEEPVDDIYTEEYLNTKSKAELQDILDSLGINYKKNNSVNTLISLILNGSED